MTPPGTNENFTILFTTPEGTLVLSKFTALIILISFADASFAATPVATYRFNNTFSADELGAPALVPTDPLVASAFVADTVFGDPHQVWSFDGNASPPAEQAGVTLNTTGLISPASYSVDMVFLFSQGVGAWRRIIDVENRQSDSGFYVDPSNNLDIFPVSGSTAAWTNNVYHHIVLTNDGTTVNTYLDGISQFTTITGLMNVNNPNNPGLLLNFFLDNVVAGGQGEFSDGRVALIRIWDGVLSPVEAQRLASNPYVPEPSAFLLATLAVGGLNVGGRRR